MPQLRGLPGRHYIKDATQRNAALARRLLLSASLFFILQKAGAFPDGLAKTPVMGWNSWNAFGGSIDEELIRRTADDLIKLGLQDAGYIYLNIDDGWSEPERGSDGRLQANAQRFPSGIPSLANYVHAQGLKLGIYGDAGSSTCLGFPGSRGYEHADAALWASWGIDYLKFDNCYAKDDDSVIERYQAMRRAISATGHPMIFSLCEWGVQAPWLWAPQVGHSWRTTADISPTWSAILSNLDGTIGLAQFAGPGAWNDPDMLEIGNGKLNPAQERSHFALWVILKAPLLIGADLRKLNPDALALLKSRELLAVHQDELGVAGDLVWKQGAREVYACPLKGRDRAVVLFSRHFIEYKPTIIAVKWEEIGLEPGTRAAVRDLLNKRDFGVFIGSFAAAVAPHDVVAVRVAPIDGLGDEEWRPWHGKSIYGHHTEEESEWVARTLLNRSSRGIVGDQTYYAEL